MNKKIIPLMLMGLCLFACEDNAKNSGNSVGDDREISAEAAPADDFTMEVDSESIQRELKRSGSESGFLNPEDLSQLYSEHNYAPVWKNSSVIREFHTKLKSAESEGLSYSAYHGEEIDRLFANNNSLEGEEAARLELLLSDAFLEYAHDLFYGKTDPTALNKHWGVHREDRNFRKILQESAKNAEIAAALDELKPQHEIYSQLKESLQEYKSLKEEEKQFDKVQEGDLIKAGEKDPRLPGVVKRLQELGYMDASGPVQDSTYSEELQAAVRKFQESKALQGDGIIGNSTIRELNMSASQRYEQILANLERWRWYPRDLGAHHILINIPNFRLAVVRDGDTIREHNVIAGSKARPTPIFSDTLQYIVINPEWHIPPTIKSQDVIPKATKDPSYLNSNNMSVRGPGGEKIDPSSIDWSDPKVKSYNFVQTSGPTNPLGRVKIIYPNKYLIYLHDTPAKGLFERSERAESSGCVRVENAIDLAAYVVEDHEEWSEEQIRKTIDGGKTKKVKINRPIQVHHFYWTAWRAGGKTLFANDVYNLDKKIYTSLTQN